MIQEARLTLPSRLLNHSGVKLIFREGQPHEVEDLTKVSVLNARVVIVLGGTRDPAVADCMVTSVVLAVQALASSEDGERDVGTKSLKDLGQHLDRAPVIAEMRLPESVRIASALGGPSVYGIATSPIVENVWVLCGESITIFQRRSCSLSTNARWLKPREVTILLSAKSPSPGGRPADE